MLFDEFMIHSSHRRVECFIQFTIRLENGNDESSTRGVCTMEKKSGSELNQLLGIIFVWNFAFSGSSRVEDFSFCQVVQELSFNKKIREIEKSSTMCLMPCMHSDWNYVFCDELNDNRLELIY